MGGGGKGVNNMDIALIKDDYTHKEGEGFCLRGFWKNPPR